MKIPCYQVDAFAADVFRGNPAAVRPLETGSVLYLRGEIVLHDAATVLER